MSKYNEHTSITSLERRSNTPFSANTNSDILLEFKVENIDEDYERLKKSGIEIVNPLANTPASWGTRGFYFKDPDGNLLDFFSDIKKIGVSKYAPNNFPCSCSFILDKRQ